MTQTNFNRSKKLLFARQFHLRIVSFRSWQTLVCRDCKTDTQEWRNTDKMLLFDLSRRCSSICNFCHQISSGQPPFSHSIRAGVHTCTRVHTHGTHTVLLGKETTGRPPSIVTRAGRAERGLVLGIQVPQTSAARRCACGRLRVGAAFCIQNGVARYGVLTMVTRAWVWEGVLAPSLLQEVSL